MVNKRIIIVLFSAALCFFQYSKVYCQTTTTDWKQVRADREARERRYREDRKAAADRIKNTKITSTTISTKENTNTSTVKGLGCDGDCKNGYGTYRYDKNQTYFGNWKNGKKEGIGEMWYPDGSYKGDWKNDLFDGTGTRIYMSTDVYKKRILEKYTGEWKEGKRSGSGEEADGDGLNRYVGQFLNDGFIYGSIYFRSGEKYTGGYSNNGFTGFGTMYNSNGKIAYSGEYKNHYQHGKGTATTDDGIYKGIWKEGKLDIVESITNLDGSPKAKKDFPGAMGCVDGNCITGTGEYRHADYTYIGEWSGGKRNGAGVLKYGTDLYTGNFVNDLFEGKGVLQHAVSYSSNFPNSFGSYGNALENKYVGMFKAGKFDGEGVLTEKGMPIYYGSFKNGLFHGKGRFIYPENYLRYEGDFVDGLFEGYGILYDHRREKVKIYEGNFKKGKRHGTGKQYIEYLALKNMRLEGEWVDGELKGTGVLYKEDTTIFYSGVFGRDYIPIDCIGNCQNGTGQKFNSNEKKYYIGEWKDGKWHGMGKEYTYNGEIKYEGQFRDGVRHGKGVSYGDEYRLHHVEAKWENGKKEGKGTLYYKTEGLQIFADKDGNSEFEIILAVFKNDVLITTKPYIKN